MANGLNGSPALDELNHLKHKYGRTTEEILKHFEQIQKEFHDSADHDQKIEEFEAAYKEKLAA